MSTVNFISGINNIEQEKPLSKWAAEFIHSHSLSRVNFAATDVFRNLSRREKDAVRYQLRKCTETRKSTLKVQIRRPMQKLGSQPVQKVDLFKLARIGLSIWISIFLLSDIVEVYITKGASCLMAWQAALLVEICIVSASMSRRTELRRVAYALFAYNVLIFAFMEVDQLFLKTTGIKNNEAQVFQKRDQIAALRRQIKEQEKASSESLRQLNSAHERGFVTSGSIAFVRISGTLKENTERMSSEISLLEREIADIGAATHTYLWVWLTASMYFVLRCILQFFSIRLLSPKMHSQ